MSDLLSIKVGKADGKGNRVVLLSLGRFIDRDKFDVESQFQRRRYRERVVPRIASRIGDSEESDLNAEIEQKLNDAIEDADSGQIELWNPLSTSMIDVAPLSAEWFWEGYIPKGAITVIDGDPGLGKSQATIDITARCSRGDAMPPYSAPDGTYEPGVVLLTNCEDDPARVIRPRLDAAGASLDRVHLLREMDGLDGEERRLVSLPGDLAAIEMMIVEKRIGLWVIDPWVAYLDGKLSMNNDADVRRCLGQLAAMAERTGVAVVLIRHLNKKTGSHAIYRGGGSIGITGAARSVLMVGTDPDDPDSRILASVKSNLGPEPPSLRFTIESYGDTSRVVWGDSCDVRACDLLGQEGKKKSAGKREQAEQIISDVLADGPRGESDVVAEIEAAGISRGTYFAARKSLRIVSEKTGYQGMWMLSLPSVNGRYPEFNDVF